MSKDKQRILAALAKARYSAYGLEKTLGINFKRLKLLLIELQHDGAIETDDTSYMLRQHPLHHGGSPRRHVG